MSFPDLILTLLDKQAINFETLRAPDAVSLKEHWLEQTVPLSSVARLAMLQDQDGLVLAFLPADRVINLYALQNILHRELRFVSSATIANHLKARLALSDFKLDHQSKIKIIIDEHLTNQETVHFEAPQACTVIRVNSLDLQRLADDTLIGSVFSDPPQQTQASDQPQPKNLKERIAKLDRLPAMPDMPSKILALRNNPNSTVDQLVELIEQDLALSALVLRYANSAIYATREKVISLKDAIFRILGYETVLHLSLGYALGRVFKLPEKGPLGQLNFWQHATYSATLAQQLAAAMPAGPNRPKPGMIYLSGLLHDVGFLVLHLFFKNEHAWLNKMLEANPDQYIVDMEKRLLGVSHNELGAWLMQAWKMPEELIITVEHHHNLSYSGRFAEYTLLQNLTERLLKMHSMSDGDTDDIPPQLLEKLGLEEEQVFLIMDDVLTGGETLREIARSISA